MAANLETDADAIPDDPSSPEDAQAKQDLEEASAAFDMIADEVSDQQDEVLQAIENYPGALDG